MEKIFQSEKEFDLEAGVILSEELGQMDTVSGATLARTFLTKFCKGFDDADTTIKVEMGLCLLNISAASAEQVVLPLNNKAKGEEAANLAIGESNMGKEKRKVSSKKSSKPPRPPQGLSLDASDHKLVKEIAELAMLKRARTERMKALKKLKAAKASSSGLFSSGSMFSMPFTIVFFLVILFQVVYPT